LIIKHQHLQIVRFHPHRPLAIAISSSLSSSAALQAVPATVIILGALIGPG
jgi:hypothetical protein